MPLSQPYFLDGDTLLTSTAVYSNSTLTVCAPDGWYSDGAFVRQQVSCVLLPAVPCSGCGNPCNQLVTANPALNGDYLVSVDTGSLSTDVGAIIVKFNSYGVPNGIIAELDGVFYNELSSPGFGRLASSTPGIATYIGNTADDCGISGSFHTLTKYSWNGTAFVVAGGSSSVGILPAQVALTAGDPGECIMVIPKLTATPATINLHCYAVCPSDSFYVNVGCPAPLDKFKTSLVQPSTEEPGYCELPLVQTHFVARAGNATAPYLGLYDCVFTDAFGQNKLPDGYYKTNYLPAPNDTIHVVNGVITSISNACP